MKEVRLSHIRERIRDSINLDHFDRMYVQQLFQTGEPSVVLECMKGKLGRQAYSKANGGELPDYVEYDAAFGQIGAANHALVNARIMAQGLTMYPEFVFEHEDPVVREVNAAYLSTLWQEKRWDQDFYIAAMELEANGMAQVSIGVDEDGVPEIEYAPNLDCIVDYTGKLPNKWRHVTRRYRRSVEDLCEMYPVLDENELKAMMVSAGDGIRPGQSLNDHHRKYVREWVYYDKFHHVVFIDRVQNSPIVLKLDRSGKYIRCTGENPLAGPNPFGVIPHSWWVDSWAPGIKMPTGKLESSMKVSALLNELEASMVKTIRQVPITAVDVTKIGDEKVIEQIRNAKSFEDIDMIIPTIGDIRDVVSRTNAMEFPAAWLQLRSILKEEINATSGVGDMQRGAALGGERRTRYEVNALLDQSGIQARHFRRQFAMMVEDVGRKARALGLLFDAKPRRITTESFGTIDTQLFPVETFLGEPARLQVLETSLQFKTIEQRQEEAMSKLQGFYMPFIQLGQADAGKVMAYLGPLMGHKDVRADIGMDPAQGMGMGPQVPPQEVPGISPQARV
jgi:hypothetical protein